MTLRRLAILLFLPIPLLVGALLLAVGWRGGALFELTGEEAFSAQVKGLTDLSADLLRPRLELAEETPAAHSGVNPFGVNVFLEQEPDPAVREQAVRMAAEAGFKWLRQEFVWEDIEIHGKGDFEDRRHEPHRSAWDKYDHIVDLAEKYGMDLIVRVSNPPAVDAGRRERGRPLRAARRLSGFRRFRSGAGRAATRAAFATTSSGTNRTSTRNGATTPSARRITPSCSAPAATAARAADPDVVIINGALASTIVLQPAAPPPGNALNDFLFLQRMYDAGAGALFRHRGHAGLRPLVWPHRPAHEPPRAQLPPAPVHARPDGRATATPHKADLDQRDELERRAGRCARQALRAGDARRSRPRYLALAYERIQEEWPWLGVANTWYFKRPDYQWRDEGKPEYYFRLVEPDFTPLPVYGDITAYAVEVNSHPVLYPGAHPPDHWAIRSADYRIAAHTGAALGQIGVLPAGGSLRLTYEGASLRLLLPAGAPPALLQISVDDAAPRPVEATPGRELRIRARGRPA